MDLDVLRVKFTHSNTVRDKRPYTIYEIEVRSSSTITWVIYKRYSSFYILHQALVTSLANVPGAKNVKLPNVPPKRLTRSLASEFVEKRKLELEEYLKTLLSIPQVLQCEVMLSFLEVPDSVRPMLCRGLYKNASDSHNLESENRDMVSEKLNYGAKSPEEKRVLDLIAALKSQPNKVAALHAFEEFFFTTRPRLTPETIRILYEGTPSKTGPTGGLLACCGNFRYSHVASRSALCLLDRLLDTEKNKDAPTFIEQVCLVPASSLQKLKLNAHVLSSRGNRKHAFRIINVILNHVEANRSSNPTGPDITLDVLVQDESAKAEFHHWLSRNEHHHEVHNHPTPSVEQDHPVLRQGNHKALSSTGFHAVLDLLDYSDDVANDWTSVQLLIPTPEYRNVHLCYRKLPDANTTVLRASILLEASVEDVIELVSDLSTMPFWDVKVRSVRLIKKLDQGSDVVHLVFKSLSNAYQCIDFCLLRSITRLDDGGALLLLRSVQSPKCPDVREPARCIMKPSGYVITPIVDPSSPTQTCMLTYVLQLDKSSILLVSQDLLGENDEVMRSLNNIQTILQNKASS